MKVINSNDSNDHKSKNNHKSKISGSFSKAELHVLCAFSEDDFKATSWKVP